MKKFDVSVKKPRYCSRNVCKDILQNQSFHTDYVWKLFECLVFLAKCHCFGQYNTFSTKQSTCVQKFHLTLSYINEGGFLNQAGSSCVLSMSVKEKCSLRPCYCGLSILGGWGISRGGKRREYSLGRAYEIFTQKAFMHFLDISLQNKRSCLPKVYEIILKWYMPLRD